MGGLKGASEIIYVMIAHLIPCCSFSEVVSNYGTYPPSCEREFVPYLSLGPMCRYATDLVPMVRVLAGKGASLLKLDVPASIPLLFTHGLTPDHLWNAIVVICCV